MRVVSVNVGLPVEVLWEGKRVKTGIFKEPREGTIVLYRLNLDGDRQADLSVHGGEEKAVYVYPLEHYSFWSAEYPELDMPWGMFGENLTTEGIVEKSVNIGDQFRIGSAEVAVTQPRLPCFKLGIRFGRKNILKRFLASSRSGWYFKVLQEGEISAGCEMERTHRQENSMSIAEILNLYVSGDKSPQRLQHALQIEPLSEAWKKHFRGVIERLGVTREG
jgi:MOSC domain-containing protein YiiM